MCPSHHGGARPPPVTDRRRPPGLGSDLTSRGDGSSWPRRAADLDGDPDDRPDDPETPLLTAQELRDALADPALAAVSGDGADVPAWPPVRAGAVGDGGRRGWHRPHRQVPGWS
jgi:hypothetical protein